MFAITIDISILVDEESAATSYSIPIKVDPPLWNGTMRSKLQVSYFPSQKMVVELTVIPRKSVLLRWPLRDFKMEVLL